MVDLKAPVVAAQEQRQQAVDEAPEFEKVSWSKDPALRKLYINCTFGLLVGSATTGYDGSLLNLLQQYDYWEAYFDHVGTDKTKANLLGLLTNMFTIGSILSMFAVPWITDRYGRKPCIIAGCVFMIFGCIINTAAQNYGMFCAGRFILGFGNSLSQLASPMLLTEVVHPQHRAPFTSVYNCLWNFGSFCTLFSLPRLFLLALTTNSLQCHRLRSSVLQEQLELENPHPPPDRPSHYAACLRLG